MNRTGVYKKITLWDDHVEGGLGKALRYRWLIALILFILGVSLKLNGSSIGYYYQLFPTVLDTQEAEDYWVTGQSRPVRSDEYAVHTPVYFSQEFNDYQFYSTRMGIDPTNMVLDYYAPVKDLTVVGKPFNWGYLLFGSEIGLSWYWCMMEILLFVTALEMFLILTKGSSIASVAGMLLVGFSPAMQWWILPHITIVFIYAMGIFDVLYYFFASEKKWIRWLMTALGIMAVAGFCLSLFPSLQVVLAYTIFVLLILVLYRDRREIWGDWRTIRSVSQGSRENSTPHGSGNSGRRETAVRLLVLVLACGFILGRFLLMSRDEIYILLNTAYPGQRVSTGGDQSVYSLFTNLTALYLPDMVITDNSTNVCESSSFIQFAPVLVLLFPYFLIGGRQKKGHGKESKARIESAGSAGNTRNVENANLAMGMTGRSEAVRMNSSADRNLGIGLLAIMAVEAFFMLIGFPEWLSKVTLFKYANRMNLCYGWTAAVFSVWSIDQIWKRSKEEEGIPVWYIALGITLLFGLVNCLFLDRLPANNFRKRYFFLEICIFCLILFFALLKRKIAFMAVLAVTMVIAGFRVNPICRGASPLYNHPISKYIKETSAKDPDAAWLTVNVGFGPVNFFLANGARMYDATNYYPDFSKWDIINPEAEYEDDYNRYLNMEFYLTDGELNMELPQNDLLKVSVNPDLLKDMGISYLISGEETDELLDKYGLSYTKEFEGDNYYIYHLRY